MYRSNLIESLAKVFSKKIVSRAEILALSFVSHRFDLGPALNIILPVNYFLIKTKNGGTGQDRKWKVFTREKRDIRENKKKQASLLPYPHSFIYLIVLESIFIWNKGITRFKESSLILLSLHF